MLRSMMQIYIKKSAEAVELYQKAFDAKIVSETKNDDGSYMHAELNIFGQILAIAETLESERITGNTMQFCFHFSEYEIDHVKQAYEILKEDAEILFPLGPSFFSQYMFGLIDKFGVNWCVFI